MFNVFSNLIKSDIVFPKAKIIPTSTTKKSAKKGNLNIKGTGESIDKFVKAELSKDEIERAFKQLNVSVTAIDYSVAGRTETHALFAPYNKLSSLTKEAFMEDLQGELGLKVQPTITSLSGDWVDQNENTVRKNIIELTVEREDKIVAHLGDYLHSKLYWSQKGGLVAPLGHGSESLFIDLTTLPHLLVVGTSGSGKSVFLESLLFSIHHRYTVNDVQFALIDPKRVELVTFKNSPLIFKRDGKNAFFTDSDKAVDFLIWLNTFIDERYKDFAEKRVKNIVEHNSRYKKIPYVVCVIDEFAKLTETDDSSELFSAVRRITAEARAAGVVLIVSTQTPNKDVLPVQIRTNLQSRIAFRIADKVDAESVVRIPEAFNLTGKGDGIFLDNEGRKHRFSGCFIDSSVDPLISLVDWEI